VCAGTSFRLVEKCKQTGILFGGKYVRRGESTADESVDLLRVVEESYFQGHDPIGFQLNRLYQLPFLPTPDINCSSVITWNSNLRLKLNHDDKTVDVRD